MHYDMKKSGIRIQNLRKGRGITQEQLADQLNTCRTTIGRIERGTKGASIDFLIELVALFDTSLDYVILGRAYDNRLMRDRLNQMTAVLSELLEEM